MFDPWTRKRALIVVRTYPAPAWKGVEVSCTAAISPEGEWLRLFPVPWRLLPADKQFRKYQWIEAELRKAKGDSRRESHNIRGETIEILSSVGPESNWASRKELLYPLRVPSLCFLVRARVENRANAPTLGLVKPKTISSLEMKPGPAEWTPEQLMRLRQNGMFDTAPPHELERIPFTFKYHFTCDDKACRGHDLLCSDWEMAESYRRWSREYGSEWMSKFRQRYETEMIELNDTHFFVGTVHNHPNRWNIVGLFYPRFVRSTQHPGDLVQVPLL